ncbi:unnamed protein product [Rhizophagus irregularis]|uniref:Uncharacterized protein n=1 Tax=Rhizophagus irregularis TaxID=588596 RepID=A0A2I1GYX6_9GLOM|nr:hypothetical protein RhiirA4_469109 [Rhizophagus irregularis]CAB4423350.1 unnamed protein product [Rhizophagus irregularis]
MDFYNINKLEDDEKFSLVNYEEKHLGEILFLHQEDLGSKILKKILEEILRENFSEGTAQKEPIVSSSSHNKELSQD